jgi:hypothetical protein
VAQALDPVGVAAPRDLHQDREHGRQHEHDADEETNRVGSAGEVGEDARADQHPRHAADRHQPHPAPGDGIASDVRAHADDLRQQPEEQITADDRGGRNAEK